MQKSLNAKMFGFDQAEQKESNNYAAKLNMRLEGVSPSLAWNCSYECKVNSVFFKGMKICVLVVCVLVEVSISKTKMEGKIYRPMHRIVTYKDIDRKVRKCM